MQRQAFHEVNVVRTYVAQACMGSLVLACGLACANASGATGGQSTGGDVVAVSGADAEGTVEFDIQALPLQVALERYSSLTGWSVLYQGALAQGRTSRAVKGRFTPDAGLRMLIDGTGLMPRHSGPDRVVLLPTASVPVRSVAPARTPPAYIAYYGSAQANLRRRFCQDARLAPGDYRAAIQLDIGGDGRPRRVKLLDTTRDPSLDAALVETISATAFEAPPAGMPQPLTLLILPKTVARSADCPGGRNAAPVTEEEAAHG